MALFSCQALKIKLRVFGTFTADNVSGCWITEVIWTFWLDSSQFLLCRHLTITDTSIILIAATPLGKKVITLVWLNLSPSVTDSPGERRYPTKFFTGGSAARSNLLYFYIHFCQRRYYFHVPSIDKWYPLDIPSLELHIAFKCWKCTLFKIWINLKQERFLDFFTAIKCICQSFRPFKAPKWQISLPFHSLQQAATISCDGEEKCDVISFS